MYVKVLSRILSLGGKLYKPCLQGLGHTPQGLVLRDQGNLRGNIMPRTAVSLFKKKIAGGSWSSWGGSFSPLPLASYPGHVGPGYKATLPLDIGCSGTQFTGLFSSFFFAKVGQACKTRVWVRD